MLAEGEGQAGWVGKLRMLAGQEGVGVGVGGEAVHQQEGQGRAGAAAQKFHLADDDVQKAEAVFGDHQGFGLVESHAGAEAAVEADDDGAGDGGFAFGGEFVEVLQAGEWRQLAECCAGDDAQVAVAPAAAIVDEGFRDQRRRAVGGHTGADVIFNGGRTHGQRRNYLAAGRLSSMAARNSFRCWSRRAARV